MYPFIDVSNTLSAYVLSSASEDSSTSSLHASSSVSTIGRSSPNHLHTIMENVTRISVAAGSGAIDIAMNVNDSMSAYVPPLERPETIFIAIIYTLIFIVGVLGNGTLVIIFFRHRSMRNIPNTYILSLALADLLVIIVCVPLATLVYTTDSWTFGKSMCQITEFFKDVSIGVSVFTLTALSGERYCAIVNPLRKLQTKPLTVITATMIWLLSIMFATPSLIMSDLQVIEIDRNLTIIVCSPFGNSLSGVDTYPKYVVVTKAFVYYLLPLVIIGVLYLMMAQRLHVSARDMPGESQSMQSRSQVRARRYVARMVVAFVVVFFICFFPYHIFELWYHLNPTSREDFDEFWHILRIIGFCTYFLNSCINPVALYCVSGAFRAHFNQYLCCWCVKRQLRLRQHSTATGMMDTSIVNMSMRSSIHYNRASVHLNNVNTCRITEGAAGGGIIGRNGSGKRLSSGYRRTSTMLLQHNLQLQQQQQQQKQQQQKQQQQLHNHHHGHLHHSPHNGDGGRQLVSAAEAAATPGVTNVLVVQSEAILTGDMR